MDFNPSAARSLEGGFAERLTVHRLHMPAQLRKTAASTNVIESAFAIVERVCVNVKRWHGGDRDVPPGTPPITVAGLCDDWWLTRVEYK